MNFKTRYFSITSILGIIFTIAGLFVFSSGVSNSNRIDNIRDNGGISVTATIISIDTRLESRSSSNTGNSNTTRNSQRDTIFTPNYEYTDEQGVKHTTIGASQQTRSSSPDFTIGDTATVMYAPDDPENSFIDTGESSDGGALMMYFPLMFSAIGLGLVVFDLVKSTKARRSETE